MHRGRAVERPRLLPMPWGPVRSAARTDARLVLGGCRLWGSRDMHDAWLRRGVRRRVRMSTWNHLRRRRTLPQPPGGPSRPASLSLSVQLRVRGVSPLHRWRVSADLSRRALPRDPAVRRRRVPPLHRRGLPDELHRRSAVRRPRVLQLLPMHRRHPSRAILSGKRMSGWPDLPPWTMPHALRDQRRVRPHRCDDSFLCSGRKPKPVRAQQ